MAQDLIQTYTLEDLRGIANCGTVTLLGHGNSNLVTLPDQPCKFAMLSQWTVGVDNSRTAKTGATASTKGSGSAGVEIYWGFNGKLFGQLFTGERTEMLPINNLNQLCASGTSGAILFYAWFE